VLLLCCGGGIGWREDVEMLLANEYSLPTTTTFCSDSVNDYVCVKEWKMWQCSLKPILSFVCNLILTRSLEP
jgi:hypothetical protein